VFRGGLYGGAVEPGTVLRARGRSLVLTARVFVTLKGGVLDPQGRAVARALAAEGFGEVEDARVGKVIELRLAGDDVAAAKVRVTTMCEKLLANTVIESYDIDIRN